MRQHYSAGVTGKLEADFPMADEPGVDGQKPFPNLPESELLPASPQWRFGELFRQDWPGSRPVYFFSSAGQFASKVIMVVLVRSPVTTANRWPSALTSYNGKVRSGRLGKSS